MARDPNKYINIDNDIPSPKKAFFPIKEATEKLLESYARRRWVTILNKQDVYRYFLYKTIIHNAEEQLWVWGEGIIVNQNPESKVTIRNYCVKTRKWCCGHDGDITNEYFAVCPYCQHIFVAVADSTVPCDYCRRDIECNKEETRWIKYSCINCPANIGLDEANLKLDYAYNNQFSRKI